MWKELQFPLENLDAERVEAALEELGALAVTLEDAADDALLEPAPGEQPLWPSSRVRALFDADQDVAAIAATLRAQLGGAALPDPQITQVADQQWETAWRRDFKPMRFGARLWVCPSGEPAPDGAIVVRLDPGLAFGTGTHPTTALCLEWLAQAPLAGQRVIDYGCGSGILAIAAAKLGADRVYAVDYDAQALTATRENAAANGVADKIETISPELFGDVTAEVLVANILARPLVELAAQFASLVKPGGRIAVSGVLQAQCD
ncbi:MAG TPA: 50S ribosomal protein L11 methyltransferase, partial [Gammaproteobacteria bacterium]|nr:50S ribosomal protein L11 methyltransferase [Gammaproteobacteria bacterium]